MLSGDDWEQFCVQALERKFDPDFQAVPARFRGDYGMDGYVRDDRLFQCFGDEAGASASQRSDAQRRKLRDEIPKLRRNAEPIGNLVGTNVAHYLLLVSKLENKAVVEAAREHTQEVLAWELQYLSVDFQVIVKDFDYLKAEWETLYGSVQPQLDLPGPIVGQTEIDRLAEDPLAKTLTEKLAHIFHDDDVVRWRNTMLLKRATEVARLDGLRGDGAVFERVRQLKNQQEDNLEMRSLATDPSDDLLRLADSHAQALRADVQSLPLDAATELAWGAIADWLMRCPLDYRSRP